jgi:nucleosome binding factor SPN SPT16 subunit
MEVVINAEQFALRLKKLHATFLANRETNWNGADVLCIPMGANTEEDLNYSKSSALHLYLMGYEFSDSIIVLTKNTFCLMAAPKKCTILETAIQSRPVEGIKFEFFRKTKDEGANRECFNSILGIMRKNGATKIGSLLKVEFPGTFIPAWKDALTHSTLATVDISASLGAFFAVKDESELVSV